MLWWFLILAASGAVVVSVAISLFMRVRKQLKRATPHPVESEPLDEPLQPPENRSL
jgi:hypothetical protein